MDASSQLKEWSKSLHRRCWPFRITKNSSDSWIFPTPWINGPQVAESKWEYCCFRLQSLQEPVFVRICTTLIDEYGAANDAHAKYGKIYGEDSGFFFTTFHSELPAPQIPALYGFEVFSPIIDPEGPHDKTDPAWDSLGQWLGHKIGGAPFTRLVGPVKAEIHELLQNGYELLLQLSEPSFSIVNKQECDDYVGEWLFEKDRFCVLIDPRTMDIRYVWG
ncbi:hypothetical protein CfE428DRAFT_5536 [Chthoniobacter flavus Ellin428]|uniref:Uncharacterized protein n=1 Tax=Chthoniobacter flavus Ellin428 TaxID=497964 RepID=B4D9E6_9BACT|nr:hypothetical protein CfE428DRAFT_5536 [Chthoniobacter flavus Ellin428]TCO87788.1 hypothetical protein EV701_12087 [Chthoniobacter flavus]